MSERKEVERPFGRTRTIDMPSVLINIPFKEYATVFKEDESDFQKDYEEVKKELLFETRREFDNYRVRAGVKNRDFIKTIYLSDMMYTLRVMIPDDLPSTNTKKIITLSKFGNPIMVTAPISTDKVWISDGITRNTFLTRIEEKYTAKLFEVLLAEKVRRFLGG